MGRVSEILMSRGLHRLYIRGYRVAHRRGIEVSDHGGFYVFYIPSSETSMRSGAPSFYMVTAGSKGFKCTCMDSIIKASRSKDEKGWRTLCKHCVAAAIILERLGRLTPEMVAALEEAADFEAVRGISSHALSV
jgi:hypothetical protein